MPGSGRAALAGPWPVRLGLLVVVIAYALGALFGIAGPFLWGHHGYHGATYMLRAIMTLRFHIVTPSNWAGFDYPPRFSWYFHHPIGYHHLLVPFVWLLGAHEWVGRGFAAAGGLLMLWALHALVRRHFSRELGLLAVAVVVAMPFVTQFAVLLDPMFPAMALTLVSLDAFLRYWGEPERRWLVRGCAGFVGAGLLMWDGYFEAFFLGCLAMALLVTRGGRSARLLVEGRRTRWNAWLAWTVATGVCSALAMGFHFVFTWKVGMMSDFRASYQQRHAATFDYVYGREQEWAQVLFGKYLLVAGALWLALFVGRLAAGRARRRDVAVWLFLVNKTFYIFLFREAAAVHEYRVDWYLLFLALAVVDLADDLGRFVRFVLARWPRVAQAAAPAAMVLAGVALLAAEAPAGYRKLIESRERMGTDATGFYDADYPRQLFAMEVARKTGPLDFVFTLAPGFPHRIEFYFYMDRSNLDIHALSQLPALRRAHPRSLLLLNPAALGPVEHAELVELLRHHPAEVYDGFMVVDFRSTTPGLREFSFAPRPASRAYRFFVSHKYPPMKPVPRTSIAVACLQAEARLPVPPDAPPPGPLPAGAPSPEQAACLHNYLVLRGDSAGAAAVIERVRAGLPKLDVALGAGLRVVALHIERRTADVWLVLDAPAKVPPGALQLRLRATPELATPRARPIVVEQPLPAQLATLPPGWLHGERFILPAARGRYHAAVELVQAPPPPPHPPGLKRPAPPPPIAAIAIAIAIADMGPIELR